MITVKNNMNVECISQSELLIVMLFEHRTVFYKLQKNGTAKKEIKNVFYTK
jgi:hypothetical protein